MAFKCTKAKVWTFMLAESLVEKVDYNTNVHKSLELMLGSANIYHDSQSNLLSSTLSLGVDKLLGLDTFSSLDNEYLVYHNINEGLVSTLGNGGCNHFES